MEPLPPKNIHASKGYGKDSNLVNKEGGNTLAELSYNIEPGKLGPG